MSDSTHIDLFAGCGGFSAGCRAAGFRTVAAVELDPVRASTFRLNFPNAAVLQDDIRGVTVADLARRLPGGRPPDLLTAGPPCQPFSSAATRTRRADDGRVGLAREVVRLAAGLRPRVLLIENVPRFADSAVAEVVRRDLGAAGYTNRLEVVLDAADHGIPQHRRRWFLIAARDGSMSLPLPATAPSVSVREAFAGLPGEGPAGGYGCLLADHGFWGLVGGPVSDLTPPRASAARVARYALVRPGRRVAGLFDQMDADVVGKLQATGVLPGVGFKQSGQRLRWDRPAPTVTATAADRLLHPRVNRALSVRECARLQGFPDGFLFGGGTQERYRQIGDAVPPLLAWRWADAISQSLVLQCGT